ncbi:hypothetical protein BDF14DRAFT_476641 [Spinellus fusiger]|nr:hypothetical protein BDF14DRAFT_476641 [Spinellus fusiger]
MHSLTCIPILHSLHLTPRVAVSLLSPALFIGFQFVLSNLQKFLHLMGVLFGPDSKGKDCFDSFACLTFSFCLAITCNLVINIIYSHLLNISF